MRMMIDKWFIASIAIVVSLFFVACDDVVDDGLDKNIVYTELQGLDMNALDSCEYTVGSFTLEASGNWRVESDKMWLTFSKDSTAGFFNDLKGTEGNYTIYVKVSNVALQFAETSAEIRLIAGDEVKATIDVVRPAMEHKLQVVNKNEVVTDIQMGSSGIATVRFDANYEFNITDYPEWLAVPVLYNGNYTFEVIEDSVPVACNGEIVVCDSSSTVIKNIGIVYEGMNPNMIKIESEHNPWWWSVSNDGKTLRKIPQVGTNDTTEVVVKDYIEVDVTCREYDYTLFCVDVVGELFSLSEKPWIKGSKDVADKGKLTITVDEFKDSTPDALRMGYLFAVPEALCDSFKTTLPKAESVEAFVEFFTNYVVIEVTQEGAEDAVVLDPKTYVITDNEGNVTYSVVEETYQEYIGSEYSVDDVAACEIECGKTYDIDTRMTGGSKLFSLAELKSGGCPIIENHVEAWQMSIKKTSGTYHLAFTVPADFDKDAVVVRFYQGQNINIKALVMRIKK